MTFESVSINTFFPSAPTVHATSMEGSYYNYQ